MMKIIRIRRIGVICLGLLMLPMLPIAAVAGDWDIDALMRGLAENRGGRAKFVETKNVAILDKPVVSSGELDYTPPGHLEKRTLKPKQELMVLDGDTVRLERGKQIITIRLSEHPEALAFVDSLRGALAGDKKTLEKNYKLRLSGSAERWTLDLLPDDQGIAAYVVRITFGGSGNQLEWIRYLQADGDSSTMTIEQLGRP